MYSQPQDEHIGAVNEARERKLSVNDYAFSLMLSLHIGARWGHCYENAYPAFFAFPQLFEPHGRFVEGWVVIEDQDNLVLMEHGWLGSGEHIIDPTIVLGVEPGQPVYYFPGVLRARAELEALENEFFPHVHFSDYGADGMSHPDYRAAYEAARQKASSLLTGGKNLVEVKAKVQTTEEEEATKRETPGCRIIPLSVDQGGNVYG